MKVTGALFFLGVGLSLLLYASNGHGGPVFEPPANVEPIKPAAEVLPGERAPTSHFEAESQSAVRSISAGKRSFPNSTEEQSILRAAVRALKSPSVSHLSAARPAVLVSTPKDAAFETVFRAKFTANKALEIKSTETLAATISEIKVTTSDSFSRSELYQWIDGSAGLSPLILVCHSEQSAGGTVIPLSDSQNTQVTETSLRDYCALRSQDLILISCNSKDLNLNREINFKQGLKMLSRVSKLLATDPAMRIETFRAKLIESAAFELDGPVELSIAWGQGEAERIKISIPNRSRQKWIRMRESTFLTGHWIGMFLTAAIGIVVTFVGMGYLLQGAYFFASKLITKGLGLLSIREIRTPKWMDWLISQTITIVGWITFLLGFCWYFWLMGKLGWDDWISACCIGFLTGLVTIEGLRESKTFGRLFDLFWIVSRLRKAH